MNLSEIHWPVFRLGMNKPLEADGVLFYSREYLELDNNKTIVSFRVVDDTSIPQDSLGLRRLVLKDQVALFPIKTAIYFLADLVKVAKSKTWFIDNSGRVFQYKKQHSAVLTCHKIQRILPGKGMGAVIEVEGILQRFKCIYRPRLDQPYVGILKWGLGSMLYGFYSEPFKTSKRKV